jgi:hypothetical protein
MPKSNHRGATYAGHVDITPAGVSEPEWLPASATRASSEDSPAEIAPRSSTRAPSPRTRKRGA